MKGRLVATLGLVLGLFGLAVLSDTILVRKVMANPVPAAIAACACQTPSGNTKLCISEENWTECKNFNNDKTSCDLYSVSGPTSLLESPIVFVTNDGKVPDGCQKTADKVNCGTESIECYKHTRCMWNAKDSKCEVDTAAKQGLGENAEKRKEEPCAPGSNCPPP